jgi:hypothetical protein
VKIGQARACRIARSKDSADSQLVKALDLARALFNYDAASIPLERRIRVRRLIVVAA